MLTWRGIIKRQLKTTNTKDMVYCCFPCSGKTWLSQNSDSVDLEISNYMTDEVLVTKEYIDDIIDHSTRHRVVTAACFPRVLYFLERRGVEHTLVFPEYSLLEEWADRLTKREPDGEVAEMMREWLWDRLHNSFEYSNCPKIVLSSGQYLSDVID